jgi:hypothetical protein
VQHPRSYSSASASNRTRSGLSGAAGEGEFRVGKAKFLPSRDPTGRPVLLKVILCDPLKLDGLSLRSATRIDGFGHCIPPDQKAIGFRMDRVPARATGAWNGYAGGSSIVEEDRRAAAARTCESQDHQSGRLEHLQCRSPTSGSILGQSAMPETRARTSEIEPSRTSSWTPG